jgi:hypothetical protein
MIHDIESVSITRQYHHLAGGVCCHATLRPGCYRRASVTVIGRDKADADARAVDAAAKYRNARVVPRETWEARAA